VNFADLSSIGAGADAADRTADVLALGVPADEPVENDADREEGQFGALLDLLALATQTAPRPPEAAGPTPGTLESVTLKERPAVDATEIFRQVTALAATAPEPGTEASLAFPAIEEGALEQEPPPVAPPSLAAGERVAQTVDAAREARALVTQAMAAARKAAAADKAPVAESKPVEPPSSAASASPPELAVAKAPGSAARQQVDIEVAQAVEPAGIPTERLARATTEVPAVPKQVATPVAPAVPETAAPVEPQVVVSASAVAAAPADAASSGLLGDSASQGDRPSSDGERAPSGQAGDARQPEATVAEPFSPQLAAKIYESAAAAASSLSPEMGELADVVPQIVRSIHLQSAGEVGHARVQLRPEHLGDVLVELRVEQGEVIASLEASRPEVREWIESRAEELKQALGAQGLELLHFSVRDGEESRREEPRERQQPRKQKRQAHDDEAVRFELPAV
jgi:chemotaxis protein MotD